MTDLLGHERRPQADSQRSSASATIGLRPVRSPIALSVVRFLRHCIFFLGCTIVVIVLLAPFLEFSARAIWSIHPITQEADIENQRQSPVYAGADWAREFWSEETSRRKSLRTYVPFRVWGVTDWHGKYINNDPGLKGVWRRTINQANCDSPHRESVWAFGGSTIYGTGVPDWGTIPSYLSRDLNAGSQECVVAANFGVEGYVIDQELILLEDLLKAGGHPDVVIFYDGVNDSTLAWPPSSSPDAHFRLGPIKNRVEGSLSGRLDFFQNSYALRLAREVLAHRHRARSFTDAISKTRPNVLAIADNYEANIRLARALGKAYGFKVYCFWQPLLIYGHKPLVPFEQQLAALDGAGTSANSAWILAMAAVYREVERRSAGSENFVFLGGLFDSTREPVYLDEGHLGPRGNEIAAEVIASYIKDHPEH